MWNILEVELSMDSDIESGAHTVKKELYRHSDGSVYFHIDYGNGYNNDLLNKWSVLLRTIGPSQISLETMGFHSECGRA